MRALALALAAVLLAVAWPAKPPLKEGLGFSQAIYDRRGRLLRLTLSPDGKYRLWTPLSELSPLLREATLLQEDKRFEGHHGADVLALARAAWTTYAAGGRRVGGSTITMQLARLRYRLRTRTLSGKLLQISKALQLELYYSKAELLEAYLNLAPYGGNVEGAGAASLIYFGKSAASLNLVEALTLAVTPQNPVRRSLSEESSSRDAARKALFARWAAAHPESRPQDALLDGPWPTRTASSLPFEAPHFIGEVLASSRDGRIVTTLDLELQKLVERRLRSYIERRADEGLRNAAAILVDARDMGIVAAVGSADFNNAAISGQVNGLRAPRSPGSTLKPFVYGLAIDQGLLHPQTMLKDAPVSFRGFNPENFDGEFVGPVKAADALIHSRNVPAVQISSNLKNPNLYEFLKSAELPLPHDEAYYGLGLALGSAEAAPEDLARLYAMLANAGTLRSLRRRLGEPPGNEKHLLTREASFIVMDMLKDNPRPRQNFSEDWTREPLPVYWKTGTSFAFRDAWTAGVFGPYVLVVWIGNFGGEGNPAFIGIEAAAPLFFDIVDAVRAQRPRMKDAFALKLHGLNVARVKVCAVSGKIPGPHCPRAISTWFIPGVSPIAVCDIHREVLVDGRSGLRACREGPQAVSKVFEFWPTDLLKIFRQAGMPRRLPPGWEPSCGIVAEARGRPPQITSPLQGIEYNVRSSGANDAIPLSAVADADALKLYWFVDGKLVGQAADGRPLFWPAAPGRYTVRVVDDQGRSDSRDLLVTLAD